jgi:putative membrane protein
MHRNPYKRFSKAELILRDELAIDRTILANERTLLSYLRGSLTLVIAGVSIIHFVQVGVLYWVGIALVPIGLASGIYGTLRYRKMNRSIRAIRGTMEHKEGIKAEPKPEPSAGSAH